MSSGLPPIVPSASQQATAQQFAGNPFPHFGYLFGPNQSIPNPFALGQSSNPNVNQQNRFKIKRHRQRVDAGEPRNTYQGTVKSRSQAQPPQLPPQITPLLQPLLQLESLWAPQQTIPNLQNEEIEETRSVREEIESSAEEMAKSGQETEEEVEEEEEDEDNDDEEEEEDDNSKGESRESPSSTSSASKRKRFQPKKIEEQLGIEQEPEQISIAVGGSSTPEQEDNDNETTDDSSDDKPVEQSAIQAQLNAPALSLLEMQKKFYYSILEQNKNRLIGLSQNKKNMNIDQLVESLKSEISDNNQSSTEKKNSEASSSTPNIEKIMPPHPIFHQPMFAAAIAAAANGTHNPLFPSSPQAAIGGGIFPSSFNMFQQLQAFNALRRSMANEEPRKKRIKSETDNSASCQQTPPTARYFPPTMVGHPMYGNMAFANLNLAAAAAAANLTDRENSPTNSDDMNDFGIYDGNCNSTLTPMHLRKAKLMFFYTRYPNSNLLKSYFPDIRFNKNNTAQLVKWFSNFREFYYIQMEKFGRQLLADGVRSRDEIFVTKDNELFKVLNTHYNRNNHIRAPDNLLFVVQETLREFYDAIRLGKDSEPSWKKTIYKIINRMDDQIPEFFKEPNFLDRLEG